MTYNKDEPSKPHASIVIHLFSRGTKRGRDVTILRNPIKGLIKKHGLRETAKLIGMDYSTMMNALRYFNLTPEGLNREVLEVARSGLSQGKHLSARDISEITGEPIHVVGAILNKEARRLANASPAKTKLKDATPRQLYDALKPTPEDEAFYPTMGEALQDVLANHSNGKDDKDNSTTPYLFSV